MTTKSIHLQHDNDITLQDRLDHANRRMIVLSALRETELYMTPAEALTLARKLETMATKALQKTMPKRVMRVRWRYGLFGARDGGKPPERGSGGLDEVYSLQTLGGHLQTSGGKFRRVDRIPGNGQYNPGADEREEWLKRLGVTHVELTDGHGDKDFPDGEYPVKKYIAWLRKYEEEDA